jgi:hypothetical protein
VKQEQKKDTLEHWKYRSMPITVPDRTGRYQFSIPGSTPLGSDLGNPYHQNECSQGQHGYGPLAQEVGNAIIQAAKALSGEYDSQFVIDPSRPALEHPTT